MTEPRTAAGRALLHFIDAAITNTTNGVSWRNGAGYARVCAEGSIPAIEAEARAAARTLVLDELAEKVRKQYAPVYSRAAKLWLLAAIDALREKR